MTSHIPLYRKKTYTRAEIALAWGTIPVLRSERQHEIVKWIPDPDERINRMGKLVPKKAKSK